MSKFTKGLGVAVVALALLVSVAVPASALTQAQADAIVAALGLSGSQAATIQALVVGGSPAAPAVAFTRDLTIGSTGSDVVALQDLLIARGHLVMPAGVSKGYFGTLTQQALAKMQAANGISPAAGFFGPITRNLVNSLVAPAPTTPTTPSTPGSSTSTTLSGGAGDIVSIVKRTSGTETTVTEGRTEKVLGFEIEADNNSDLDITSVRLIVDVTGSGSTRLTRYADEVLVMLDGKTVGSVDARDFSRSGSEHTATVALKNAIVKSNSKARFDIGVAALSNIDSNDLVGSNHLNVLVDRVRFVDATGAILSETASTSVNANVTFEDSTNNDGLRLQTSTTNPKASTLEVEENKTSDEYHVFSFRLRGDADSSDVDILSIPVNVWIDNTNGSDDVDSEMLINDIKLVVGNRTYSNYDRDDVVVVVDHDDTAVFDFEIDEGDLTIRGGSSVDVKVYVKFGKQDGNYDSGIQIELSVESSEIDAENQDGEIITVAGASTISSETHTLLVEGVFAEFISSSFTAENIADSVNGTISIVFELTAVGDDAIFANDGSDFDYTLTGADEVDAIVTVQGKTASGGDFTITEGDSRRVTLSLKFENTSGFVRLEVTEILGTVVNDIITQAY
ncbi:MAG TPA: peptidoglycan-binding domain-containing protein [Candidatus Paceibacterota bacterium]|nr:peptidoglycan-binding domain-containing protein [Candidatus Paceibacterota bacterium]